MNQLIRFEDDYGASDIVCIAQELGLYDLSTNKLTHSTLKENIFMQSGLSIGAVFDISDIVISEILKYRIDEVIFVFDMDSISGKGILTESELRYKVNNIQERIKHVNVQVKYAPVVWTAETLALYIKLDSIFEDCDIIEKCADITHIIHSKNTAKLHGALLKKLINFNTNDTIKVKHARKFIGDKSNIHRKIKEVLNNYKDSINQDVLKWIISGDTKHLFDSKDVINHQIDVIQLHNKYMPKEGDTITVYGEELSLTKVCWR